MSTRMLSVLKNCFLIIAISLGPVGFAADLCSNIFTVKTAAKIVADRGAKLPKRGSITQELAKFAEENNLPAKWIELGPIERRVKRLFVALDFTDPVLLQKYLDRFNLEQPLNKDVEGTLALEFGKESLKREHYVTGVLRTSNQPTDKIYRWGRPDSARDNWWRSFLEGNTQKEDQDAGIYGFSHLIELNKQEKENVKFYLENSDVARRNNVVGACKSTNCVAWTSSIELGTTKEGATTEERRHLFPELGIARSSAHFEIGRRLIHAASDRHTAIITFVKGEKGLDTFLRDIENNLVPEPKIPYANILKNVKFKSPADQALSVIPDGAKIFLPIAAGASPDAVNALVQRAPLLKNGYDLHVLVNGISANAFRSGIETTDGKFRVQALFLGGNLRELHSEGKVDVIPGNLSDFTRLMRDPDNTHFHYDAIIVRVSKPDAFGRYSLGPNNDMIKTIIRNRPGIKIIAEVNENVPFTRGENYLTEAQITSKFESKTALAGPPAVPPSDVDSAIGRNVGKLVESDSTLQIGIGNVFSGLPEGLAQAGKSNITISTEMFGDAMKEMMERGIATKAETGFAYGSPELYQWLNRNANVEFVETEHVNSPGRVAQIPKFHAVNTALQVNLFGEVNATMGPNGRISSPGGQVEFMSGASRSAGGKAIIAIRSTAKNDTMSTIVLNLYEGPITTPHENVTHIVTEYGIAKLAGKNESQRAMALISIAHPKFRQQLKDEAIARRIITATQASQIVMN